MAETKTNTQPAGFGGPGGPTRPDGTPFSFTPYAPVSRADSSDAITRSFLDSMALEYRFINAKVPDMHTTLFGQTFSSPIFGGGLSASVTKMRPGGMAELAQGIVRCDVPMLTGFIRDEEFEAVCATGAKAIRIIKVQEDNDAIIKCIKHDEECGAFGFAMDIDHVFGPDGNLCPWGGPANLHLAPKTTEELREIISSTKLPCIIKGVMSVHDAVCAADAGAAAILLSHHKGEIPCAVPPAYILPEIKKAVGDRLTVLVDCGITSGIDAYKVLALGADAVCVARTLVAPYMKEGADGIEARMTQLNNELRACMARTGTIDCGHFDPTTLRKRDW